MVLCNKCGGKVENEREIKEYPYYCPDCDEILYIFEVTETKNN